MGFEGFPFIIGWELTLACNLRCRHCGSSASQPRAKELSLKESLSVCEQFPELLVQEVNFTGGEPLIRQDWMEIASHLRELGIRTKILTNGLALTTDTIAQMKEVGISGVGVSLDGLETTHDLIRDKTGLFRQVVKGIKQVLEAEIPLTVITTVNSINIHELPQLFTLLQSKGVKHWQIQPIFPTGRAIGTSQILLTKQAYIEMGEFVKQWLPKSQNAGLDLHLGDSFGYYVDYIKRDPPWQGCPAGIVSCGITSDGKIKGCLSLPDEVTEGDLRQNDLWDIWFHPDSFTYTRKFDTNMIGDSCQFCKNAEQCKGGCSTMSYGSTGKFHNDPFCLYGIMNNKKQ